MKKFRVYALYNVSKFVGEFEAETEEEAIRAAEDSEDFQFDLGLCHQCNKEVGDDLHHSQSEAEEVEG